jgi:hypothetical protein
MNLADRGSRWCRCQAGVRPARASHGEHGETLFIVGPIGELDG